MARILVIAGDGSSTGHLDYARFRMREEGFDVTVAAPVKKPLNTSVHQPAEGLATYVESPGFIVEADAALDEIEPSKFDGLLLPGARAPEYLRNNARCIEVVRHFLEADKTIGGICHGPQLLVTAGIKGRRLTGIDQIKLDIEAAGATYVHVTDEAVVDGNIVTAWRTPYYHVWIRGFLSLLREKLGIKKETKVGKARILIITGDFASSGQLQYSIYRMLEAGFDLTVAAPLKKRLETIVDQREEGWEYDIEKTGYWFQANATFDEIEPSGFDALIVPGWRAAEYLRNIKRCTDIVRHFIDTDKPIASICQGPRVLVAAGLKGRRLTGLHMIKPDIINTGNTFVEAGSDPVIDRNIVTVSRRPYYYVWMRAFMALLQERGIKTS
jgi:PfpI family intracellular protease